MRPRVTTAVISVAAALAGLLWAPTAGRADTARPRPVDTSGTVWAWGRGGEGELGTGSVTDTSLPVPVTGVGPVTVVASASSTAYALEPDGTVRSWGWNQYGQLGNGSDAYSSSVPVPVTGLTHIAALAAGDVNGYALDSAGHVWAWGDGPHGELGTGIFLDPENRSSRVPVEVHDLSDVVAISARGESAYALRSDGTVWAWGFNSFGQLGDGTMENSALPVRVAGLTDIVAINGPYALRSDGTVWAWGYGQYGELGNGTGNGEDLSYSLVPVQVSGLDDVIAIAAGGTTAYALRSDHTVWGWGDGSIGQLGTGYAPLSNVPVRIPGLRRIVAIASGAATGYAVTARHVVWAWGYGYDGELGNNTTPYLSDGPVMVKRLPRRVAAIAAGADTGYAIVVPKLGS